MSVRIDDRAGGPSRYPNLAETVAARLGAVDILAALAAARSLSDPATLAALPGG